MHKENDNGICLEEIQSFLDNKISVEVNVILREDPKIQAISIIDNDIDQDMLTVFNYKLEQKSEVF
jgi:hypothetical protein